MEAQGLIDENGGFCINSYEEFATVMDLFLCKDDYLRESGFNAGNYVHSRSGATDRVLSSIQF